jgi:glyoxylase-like metal-dependent hydrolase (beta-lactamase superfamily II)
MRQLAEGVWQLRGFPPNVMNAYLVGDVLIDAGTRMARGRILRELSGYKVAAHALTHAHPDHQGASKAVTEELGIPYWVGRDDVAAAESGEVAPPGGAGSGFVNRYIAGPGRPVDRALAEGDDVAGFQVLEVPGHSAGHVAYWRESDRTLLCGDVYFGLHALTGIPGLHEPPKAFTPDPARNRESAKRLAALEPALVCFGHGPPLRDPRKLSEFAAKL